MNRWRIKTVFKGESNIYPEKFATKEQAEQFVKDKMPYKIPATLIGDAIKMGLIQFYEESLILDKNGNPITFDNESTSL